MLFFFFFSSRRRHTRCGRDWSSDVCSSDLTHQDVQNALDRVRMDTTGNLVGLYLPPGDYPTAQKFQVYGKPVRVIGAGPWYTRFLAPSTQDNTDAGFRAESTANGSVFANFAYFGDYTSRIDGPGKVFDLSNASGMTFDNLWVEHQICLYWGTNTDNMTIRNSRIRDLFADGVNMTNGSTGNLVTNNEARATGDDSFALFNAQDAGGGDNRDNVYENLTPILTWRAAVDRNTGGPPGHDRGEVLVHVPQHVHRRHAGLLGHHDQLARLRDPDERLRRQPADSGPERLACAYRWALLGRADLPWNLALLRLEGVPRYPGVRCGHRGSHVPRHHVPDELRGWSAAEPDHGHGLHEHLHLGGAAQR